MAATLADVQSALVCRASLSLSLSLSVTQLGKPASRSITSQSGQTMENT